MKIENIKIREVLATNSELTLEVEIHTKKGKVYASVPFGTSKSKYEVNYKDIEEIKSIFPQIKKYFLEDFRNITEVDLMLHSLDNSENFKRIGGNLALGISLAFLKAFALEEGIPLYRYLTEKPTIPKPVCNVAGGWKGQSDIQEFLLLPVHQTSFKESIKTISKLYLKVGEMLKKKDKNFKFCKNIESAWVTQLAPEGILQILNEVKEENIGIGLDMAASNIWNGEFYVYKDKILSSMQQLEYVSSLIKEFKIFYVEDPFHQDDFINFSILTKNTKCLVVGDDLYATNIKRLKIGLDIKTTNSVIVKPNQVGTISDTIKFVKEARKHNLKIVLSHRSGETDDVILSHLAVGLNVDYFKLGISGERIIKINEMIRIEESLD
ncbi:MAG: enolase [Candidatus Aenigmatarchaeota archaeon]